MKFVIIAALLGIAYGRSVTLTNPMIKDSSGMTQILDTRVTELDYETLLPVVRETVHHVLHKIIPESCTSVVIPKILAAMFRVHALHTLRDVAVLLEGKSTEEILVLETLGLKLDQPIYVNLDEINRIMQTIRERISQYRDLPMVEQDVAHLTPSQVLMLELFQAVYEEHSLPLINILRNVDNTAENKFEQLLVSLTTRPLTTTFSDLTLRDFITLVTKEMTRNLDIYQTSDCTTNTDVLSTLLPKLRGFVNRLEGLTVEDVLSRISVSTASRPVLENVLVKLLPVLKDTSVFRSVIEVFDVEHPTNGFMNMFIDFIANYITKKTMETSGTEILMTNFLKQRPELLLGLYQTLTGETVATLDTTEMDRVSLFCTRLSVLLRTEGVPVVDIVSVLLEVTHTDVIPEETMVYKPRKEISNRSWESMEISESTENEPTVEELFRTVINKVLAP